MTCKVMHLITLEYLRTSTCSGLSGCHKKQKWTILLLGHFYSSKMERQRNVREHQIEIQIKNVISDRNNK